MTAAHPLPPPDDFEVMPLDDACLAEMDPEERALAEAAMARLAAGRTEPVPHEEVLSIIERQRVEAHAAG
jgi:hypothetical protein